MNIHPLSLRARLMLGVVALLLTVSIFVPIWRIELSAPQYPEGLAMLIYTDKIGGDVDIINGLNHYIGMQTLHSENFMEFSVLTYLIGGFALLSALVALIGRKKPLYMLFAAFVLFGIVAMADFWRWEYNYGHNLDPKAAIVVPGMAYQPPLIGYKQLLNFGAFSVPDIGGWFFIASGLLMLLAVSLETNALARFGKNGTRASLVLLFPIALLTASCTTTTPDPIQLNTDQCGFCKMAISDGRFGCALMTAKGRTYKFDDLLCMQRYAAQNRETVFTSFFVHDFLRQNTLIPAEKAAYIVSESLTSPMGGNTAAFENEEKAKPLALQYQAPVLDWQKVSE